MGYFGIYCGDVKEVLHNYPDNSFDGYLCGPPYGLQFMGRDWDHGIPGAHICEMVQRR